MNRPMFRSAMAVLTAAGAAALLDVPPAAAQESRTAREGRALVRTITGSVPGGVRDVRVETGIGSVVAERGASPEVRYRIRVRATVEDEAGAQRLLDELALSATRNGDLLVFKGEAERAGAPGRGLSAEFFLVLPAATRSLEVVTGAGDIEIRGVPGRLTLSSRGGRIAADRAAGPIRAETRGGNIEIGAALADARLTTGGGRIRLGEAGGEVVVQTSGGDVSIGRSAGPVRAESGGGSVSVGAAGGDVFVQTGGGDILLGPVAGQVTAASGGGGIRVHGATGGVRCETAAGPIVLRSIGGPIRAVTSSGDIRAEFLPAARLLLDSDLQTWSGDVTVALPGILPLTLRAVAENSTGRRIVSDFPLRFFREAEDAGRPVETAEGEIAGGGSVVRVRTLDGRIVIVRTLPDGAAR
ncbi:MAG: DUF4097 family beta strand repeat-containing protein [Candidatus Polarisedimenticolia bacterium]